MIHLRYFDTHTEHAYLWEDLIEDLSDRVGTETAGFQGFSSAGAVQNPQGFFQSLLEGTAPEPLCFVFHFHELCPQGGYYSLDGFSTWRNQPRVVCVTGGEPRRVKEQLRAQNLQFPQLQVYPRSLSHIVEWSPQELLQWTQFFCGARDFTFL